MVLNVKKGAYPSLIQIDKEALLSADETVAVERGSLLYLNGSGEWRVAGAAQAGDTTHPGTFCYFAFQSDSDLTAQMAGGVPVSANQRPKIAGIACSPTIEVETDMFTGSPALNQFMAAGANGRLVVHADGNTALLRVTRAPYVRWINNAVAVTGWRTGNNLTVVRGVTMYVPCMRNV
jgi:hypothetical protein